MARVEDIEAALRLKHSLLIPASYLPWLEVLRAAQEMDEGDINAGVFRNAMADLLTHIRFG